MIKLLVMDVDGTLTDGKIYITNSGDECKAFHVKDGLGITQILPELNIIPVIITGRESLIVKIRAEELGIREVYQKVQKKEEALKLLMKKYHVDKEQIAYIGDDLNDLSCMKLAGVVGCPCDAAGEVLNRADYICKNPGGRGAVREFIEWLREQGDDWRGKQDGGA